MMAAAQQNGRQSHSSYSTQSLLGVATLLVVLLAVLPSYPSSAMSALSSGHHSLSKRSFFDINCKGLYDKSIFARLDRICQDCYNLYREPELHTLCRKNCFTTNYFKGCLDALLINDEKNIQSFMKDISIIHQIPI
uniref:Putative ion transport peptide-like n=1 Tax=Daphnia magna TaxID=35525 RepID=B7S5L8_9CRUS|nr:putative ion transport peptide-like precursor [Daphnia magna]